MKKLMIILVMMLVASGVNAQSKKQKTVQKDNMYAVKQAALSALKRSLIAPSQFVLTDYNGNRIGVNGIETPMHIKGSELKEWSDSTYFYKGNKWNNEEPDSIWVYKVIQKPSSSYYAVEIIGDARNRAGGYEQISRIVFVYGKAPYFYGSLDVFRPHIERHHVETIVCEKKVKKEKSVEESRQCMERNNYTPQTNVFNVKHWDVGAMNDDIEQLRKELNEHNTSNVKIR